MAAQFSICNSMNRCNAVACSSVRIRPLVDAAIILVVSICVACVRILLQMA